MKNFTIGSYLGKYDLKLVNPKNGSPYLAQRSSGRNLGGHLTYTAPDRKKVAKAVGHHESLVQFYRIETVPSDMPKEGGMADYLKKAEPHFDKYVDKATKNLGYNARVDGGLIVNRMGRVLGAWKYVSNVGGIIVTSNPNKPTVIKD
jgi:hypothetical protein